MSTSQLETRLAAQISQAGLPAPVRELQFHPCRKWRFDFAWLEAMVAVEIDGATWTGGRHTRGKGYEADAEKLNEAALMGWTVIRVTGGQVRSGQALKWVARALERFYGQQERMTNSYK